MFSYLKESIISYSNNKFLGLIFFLICCCYQARRYLVKKNGTSLVLETVSTQMDRDPIGLPGLGIGRPPVLIKLSHQMDVK
jgi:hypothetical protein